ncbi:MAG TPA: hypothetical protein VG838_15390 [Opitutaceae bacterium]|nr:hypothetical protein [Opitutaceae bacterium]
MSSPFSLRKLPALLVLGAGCAGFLRADPLSRKFEIDFYRDVASRNLKGLATRADGRLVAGPVLTELTGAAPADLLWCLEPSADSGKWLVGTGPEGRIFEVTLDPAQPAYTAREYARLDDPQVFALRRLADGTVLAGTSPKGAVYLLRDGKVIARQTLPVDSIFDILPLDAQSVLVATGNPGRLYRIDLAKFAASGVTTDKLAEAASLAGRGFTLFGEIRDRNVRRVVRLPDGRVVAGSAPKGNIYAFPAAGGAPTILQENRDGEVTDLLPQPNGDLYASIVFSAPPGESRINRPKPANGAGATGTSGTAATAPTDSAMDLLIAPAPDRFSGRGALVWFPANGFPETLVTRNNLAFYRLARRNDTLIVAGGDSGDLLGYDLQTRTSLTFAGSAAAQLNGLAPVAGAPGRFLLLKNNAPGLAVLDFAATGPREAETRRLDLGVPATLGSIRFNRLRDVEPGQLSLSVKTNFGSDEVEGWSDWLPLTAGDGGWHGDALRARYVKLRVQLPGSATGAAEIDKASLYHLPQDRRPLLVDFRVVSPNYSLIPANDPPPSAVVSLSQLLGRSGGGGESADDKKKGAFLNSQIAPQTGMQIVLWTVNDLDGDNLDFTFSIRHEGESAWTDLAVGSRDSYAQFDTSHLAEGLYFTRLIAVEAAPRPVADRLTTTFETDDLVVDRTPPVILEAAAQRNGDTLRLLVHGRDALSLLDGAEFNFNNGVHETVEQPVDGILDGKEESFSLEIPLARVSNATSVEILLYDAAGNNSARRIIW